MDTEVFSLTEPWTIAALGLSLLFISSMVAPVIYGAYQEWKATDAKGTIPESRQKFGKTKDSSDLRDDDPLKWEIEKYGPLNRMVRDMMDENRADQANTDTQD